MAVCLMLAGCESAPETPPPEMPKPETPAPKEPVQDLAWAAGQAPADACIVLTVASMADLEKNLTALVGPDGDDMEMVESIEKGLPPGALDTAGPLVFILPAGAEEMEPVILFRIKDASAIKGEAAGAGIVEVECAGGGTVFVLAIDSWAMVAPDGAEPIKAVLRAEKKVALSDAQRASIAKHTAWVHLNVDSLVAMAKGGIEKARKQMAEQPNAPKMPEATMKMLGALLALAGDGTRVEVTADVKPTGITADIEAELDEASDLFALAQSGVPVKDYKAGLPQADGLILAVWAGMDWAKAIPPMKGLMKPIFDIIAEGEDEKTRKAIDNMLASYDKWGAVMGNRFAMVMEQPKPGAGLYQLAETFTIKRPRWRPWTS